MLLRFHRQSIFCREHLGLRTRSVYCSEMKPSKNNKQTLRECKLVLLCCVCTSTLAEVCSCNSSGDQVMALWTMHLMQTFNVFKVHLFPDLTTTLTFFICPLNSRNASELGNCLLGHTVCFPRTVDGRESFGLGLVFLCWCLLTQTQRDFCVIQTDTCV